MNKALFFKFKPFFFILFLNFLEGCSGTVSVEKNPFLIERSFSFQVDLNLPIYNNLRFPGGVHLVQGRGEKGVYLFNLNGDNYFAWEASCPNHISNSCSQTEAKGVFVECACEGFQYSLATGQLLNPNEESAVFYPLLNYNVEVLGNLLVVSN